MLQRNKPTAMLLCCKAFRLG